MLSLQSVENTEDAIIKSFNNLDQLKFYLKILVAKYYTNNKQFIKSTTDINKLIDGFIQFIVNNPQKIADVLALDINIVS